MAEVIGLINSAIGLFKVAIGVFTNIISYFKHVYLKRRYEKIFGKNASSGKNVYVALDIFYDTRSPNPQRYYKLFPGREPMSIIGPSLLMAAANARVIFYLSMLFDKYCDSPINIGTDEEYYAKMDGTIVCLGSSDSNIKTRQILEMSENSYCDFIFNDKGERAIKNKKSGKIYNYSNNPPKDYGIILKINNPRYRNNSLIVCAGLGEWGTSGSAFCLSSKWDELVNRFKGESFACITEVIIGSDESVRIIDYV